ncbi:MAG: MFS transporter [Clostridiaceae bacterium]|nr:MFS transporter [Clostridiaceae bacterium]
MSSDNSFKQDIDLKKVESKRSGLVVLAVVVGTFMSALDSSVVNIALPSISSYFDAPLYIIEWVVMAYLLVISSLLLTYGRLGDMYGHKNIYIMGFIIFTAGSLLCGMASSIDLLIAYRGIQALGAGMLMAMGPAIVTEVTPANKRGRALGTTAVAVSVALATGPVLGGFLTFNFGWQSIFYINIPIGIFGTFWAYKIIPPPLRREVQSFDAAGAAVVFLSLISLLVPLSYTEKYGWRNPYILASLAAGILMLFLFVYIERRVKNPMMDLDLFKVRLFTMSNISALINYMAQFFVTLLMPFYLQQLRGLSPSEAGFMIIPMPVTTTIIAPISGALSDRFDSRYISSAGMGFVSLGIFLLSRLRIDSPDSFIMISLIVTGLGIGLFQAPNNSAIMGCVPGNRRGIASSMLATMRNMGMVMGVAVSGALFSSRLKYLEAYEPWVESFTGALSFTYTVASVLAAAAVLTSMMKGSTKQLREISREHK